MPSSTLRCPGCGREIAVVDLELPTTTGSSTPPGLSTSSEHLLLRVSEAAELLSLSRSTLYQAITKGDVRVIRIGRSVRISRREVERLAIG